MSVNEQILLPAITICKAKNYQLILSWFFKQTVHHPVMQESLSAKRLTLAEVRHVPMLHHRSVKLAIFTVLSLDLYRNNTKVRGFRTT